MNKMAGVFILMVLATNSYAGGFQLNLEGQKQLSMGGCSAALSWDPTVTFYNPGGMCWLADEKIYLGGNLIMPHTMFRGMSPSVYTETTDPQSFTPFSAFITVGTKEQDSRLTFGLGAYTPFGSGNRWPDGWLGRFVVQEIELQTVFIQPTVSYKVADNIGLGIGFVYGFGNMLLRQAIPTNDLNGADGNAKLSGNAKGIGFNCGVYYEPTEKVNFGLNFRSGVNMKVKDGSAVFSVPTSLATEFPSSSFTSNIKLPYTATLGVAYKPTDRLTLAYDLQFTGWNSYDTLKFDYALNTSSLSDTKTARNYKSEPTFRVGGQYSISPSFSARAGAYYDFTPVQDGFVTPDLPDANRIGLTAGTTVKINSLLSVDATIEYVHTSIRDGVDAEANFSGTYQTTAIVPGFALQLFF